MNQQSPIILDGKLISTRTTERLKSQISQDPFLSHRPPCLATVLVGEDEASKVYVGMKRRTCESIGMKSLHYPLPADTPIEELRSLIQKLNIDERVDGILVQMPLPSHLRRYEPEIMRMIEPTKDVDGFSPRSIGENTFGNETYGSCTPKGMVRLLEEYQLPIDGQEVVIVNRTNVIGKPLSMMFINRHATVTICHSHTRDLDFHLKRADIIAVGVGRINFITPERVKEGVIILDAGINRTPAGKLVGDVDFENVKEKCLAITPVPGGVGPMTIAMLMENTYLSYQLHMKKKSE
ncbi:MAG: bifunctional methylenetetrahydrofolate dehydrogenase/methenyltetrahydrofolate cyclohydrolase [Promethearchaeia archaeon]|nr:MAG: bifunctional methylenetetrahydrofolate dehydrogenase/methenyltetrahydrofolate cyclohydrolase [Candidatus Lokiarchaeia archaeon]